jgi:hypothetical protein
LKKTALVPSPSFERSPQLHLTPSIGPGGIVGCRGEEQDGMKWELGERRGSWWNVILGFGS